MFRMLVYLIAGRRIENERNLAKIKHHEADEFAKKMYPVVGKPTYDPELLAIRAEMASRNSNFSDPTTQSVTGSELLATFIFQAEDGIRVGQVTGVQTCALPI